MEESDFRTAQQLLELLRRKLSNCSDYRLAKTLGMTPQAIGTIMRNGGTLSDENAIALAEELELPPYYVILCMHLQRSKDDKVKGAYQEAIHKTLKAGCFILIGYLIHYLPTLSNFS